MSESGQLTLEWLPGRYAVCRLGPNESIPPWASNGAGKLISFLSITRTDRELSIVVDEECAPPTIKAERGFAALRIAGQLDFSETGILAGLTMVLWAVAIPVFVISTFDTDILLVRLLDADRAQVALSMFASVPVFPNM